MDQSRELSYNHPLCGEDRSPPPLRCTPAPPSPRRDVEDGSPVSSRAALLLCSLSISGPGSSPSFSECLWRLVSSSCSSHRPNPSLTPSVHDEL